MSGPSDWIDLVIARANDLRRAGVLSIGFDGQTATFAAYIAPPEPDKEDRKDVTPAVPVSVLDDPASYPDGIVPGWPVERLEE